jgi:hypothetical protein
MIFEEKIKKSLISVWWSNKKKFFGGGINFFSCVWKRKETDKVGKPLTRLKRRRKNVDTNQVLDWALREVSFFFVNLSIISLSCFCFICLSLLRLSCSSLRLFIIIEPFLFFSSFVNHNWGFFLFFSSFANHYWDFLVFLFAQVLLCLLSYSRRNVKNSNSRNWPDMQNNLNQNIFKSF